MQVWDGSDKKIPTFTPSGETFIAPALKAAKLHYQLCAGAVIMVDGSGVDGLDDYVSTLKSVLQTDIAVFVLVVRNASFWVKAHRSFVTHARYRVESLADKTLTDAFNWVRKHTVPCIS